MGKTSAGAADVLRFVFDDQNEGLSLGVLREDGLRDDDDDNNSTASTMFGNWWNWRGGTNNHVDTVEEAEEEHALPVRKKTRNVYARKPVQRN